MTKKKPTFKTTEKQEALIGAAVVFLREKGWNLAAIGGMSIQSRGSCRYSLNIDFTGSHPDHP